MFLTKAERITFQNWFHIQAETNEVLVSQMERIQAPEVLIIKLKLEAEACRVVANMLNVEEDSVQG